MFEAGYHARLRQSVHLSWIESSKEIIRRLLLLDGRVLRPLHELDAVQAVQKGAVVSPKITNASGKSTLFHSDGRSRFPCSSVSVTMIDWKS